MAREIADRPKRPRGRRVVAAALGLLGVVGLGLGLGSASQVTLAANPLGAGAVAIAPCHPAGQAISATFTSTFSNGAYRASAVQLTGVNTACSGDTYYFRVITTAGALVEDETGTITADGATQTEGIASTTVASIVRIELVIP